ncbi:MAG: arylesterase [Rickettsiales bacterium]|nr:arylesterase [Rickettsiales bacterium]
MRVLSVFFTMVFLLVSQSYAQGTTTTRTVAAFGDSLFAGYGLPPAEAFPAKLQQRLTADGYNIKVLPHAVSGDTTTGGLARVDFVLTDKPDLVLLELGGNDMLRATPPATTQANLDAILQRLKAANAQIILVGLKAPLNYGQQYADGFNAIFPTLAQTHSVQLYPNLLEGVLNQPGLMQPDGVHPTAAGVDVMVAGLAPWVEQLLPR